MRELRDLRTLRVDLSCLFRRHLGLERRRSRGLFAARDGPPPHGARVLWSTLAAPRAFATFRLWRAVHVRMYAVLAIQHCVMSYDLSCGTGNAVSPAVVAKRAGH